MIGNHPQLCGLPETNLFAADRVDALLRIHARQRRFAFGLLRAIAELGLGGQTQENVSSARAWVSEQGDAATARIFADLGEWAAPRDLVDKSPMHVYAGDAIERMKDAFPEARYLHLLREPRGTCASIVKTSQAIAALRGPRASPNPTPEAMWLTPHQRIAESLADVPEDRRLTMRGEELLSDPDTSLRDIARWLGVDDGATAIEAMKHPERSPFACMGPPNAPLGNDLNFLKSPALRPFTPKPVDLDSPMSWDAQVVFSDALKDQARAFGYG